MTDLDAATKPDGWHVSDEDLRVYADGAAVPPWLWSTEAHLYACPFCRERLAAATDPATLSAGWLRLDAAVDVPRPGPVERSLVWLGTPVHTARLLAATPVLRLSWLLAVAFVLAVTAAAARIAESMAVPIVLLGVAPLLPLIGVAISFGPAVDPSYELAVVAPMHTFRLLLLRCVAVLSTTTLPTIAVSFALPGYGPVVLGWLLPSLAMTLAMLALAPRFGPATAALLVGFGWGALLLSTLRFATGESIVFTPPGQAALAVAAIAGALAVWKVRPAFDSGWRPRRVAGPATRRFL
jgi:hypothetical protein